MCDRLLTILRYRQLPAPYPLPPPCAIYIYSRYFRCSYFGAILAAYFVFPEPSVSNVIGMHENAAAPGHAESLATAADMQHVAKYTDEFEKIR